MKVRFVNNERVREKALVFARVAREESIWIRVLDNMGGRVR